MTETPTPAARPSRVRWLITLITRLEIIVGAVIAALMLVLVVLEPRIVEAPFENWRTLLFTFGGTALAVVGFIAMLRLRVPPVARVVVLVVPFALVNWWLISPYFVDEVVDEGFATSISEQLPPSDETPTAVDPTSTAPPSGVEDEPADTPTPEAPPETTTTSAPSGPVLLGAGQFVGLAGHSGTGDAGLFENPDGSFVLRFENFDIQNGPDLEVYLVPGADQASLPAGSVHLGPLKGNIGDQSYDLPSGTELTPGAYTALVWCEAFSVEFVGATIDV